MGENEKNAEVLGSSSDFMTKIIRVLAAAEFLIKTKIVEVLVENLYHFSGIMAKTSYARSGSIQDAAVEALVALVEFQDGRDFVVTPGTRAKLEKVLLNL